MENVLCLHFVERKGEYRPAEETREIDYLQLLCRDLKIIFEGSWSAVFLYCQGILHYLTFLRV